MLTFQPIDLLLVAIAGLVLIAGLTFLALRRRNEILQDFLTPEEPNIEEEFFKKRVVAEKAPEEERPVEPEQKDSDDGVSWGTPAEPAESET